MNCHKILVIGCGSIGQRHARLLSEREDIRVFIADPLDANLKACAETAKIKGSFADYQQALAQGMDGVFICTPNHLHVNMTIDALKSGAHVMLEKPVAETVADAERLLKYEETTDKSVAVGYTGRFDRMLQKVKNMVDDGTLGNVVYANASVYTYRTLLFAKVPQVRIGRQWTLVVDYTHEIDFLRFLLGDAQEVAAICATMGNLELKPSPNVFEMLLKFRSGAVGSIHMDYVREPDKRTLELVGDKASIEFYMPKGLIRLYERDKENPKEIIDPFVRDDLFRRQIDNFIAILEGKQQPVVTLRDGIEALRIAEAAIRSCIEKRFVEVK